MNRTHRLVWNTARCAWQAVSETAAARGPGGGLRRAARRQARGLAALALACAGTTALGGPQGGQVTLGSASVAQSGSTTTITQTSAQTAIDWHSFSVGAGETVRFMQPGAQSVALNRVLGTEPSHILGRLSANGQVFLLNPNGVLFGTSARVDVGGLVASTLSLSNEDFAAGRLQLKGTSTGSVSNAGQITTAEGGYVVLAAPQVHNSGSITTRLGQTALAAGEHVTLQLQGGGLLGYRIERGALQALVEQAGHISADGGAILIEAKALDALASAVVNHSGISQARTVQQRDGRIVLLGDMAVGRTHVDGTLDASAPEGGNGGFIETSAATVTVADSARITTQATGTGRSGTWLIDPTDFTIGTADGGSSISASTLQANLATTDVTLQTAPGGTQAGDINVNAAVSWSAHTLTLNAANNININAVMTASGTAGLALNHGGTNGSAAATPAAGSSVNAALSGSGFTGRVDFTGTGNSLSINGKSYTLISDITALQAIDTGNLAGYYALRSDIDASATSGWNGGLGFDPIGTAPDPLKPFSQPVFFTGVLEGLGHVINRLSVGSASTGVGLLGHVSGSKIRNIGLTNVSVSGSDRVGGLVGFGQNSNISNAYVTGAVSGGQQVGGLVGSMQASTVSNAYTTTNVSGSSNVGGMSGDVFGGSVVNAYATGDVSGSNYVGGLVGAMFHGSVVNAYATGDVSSYSTAGGLIGGLAGSANLMNVYASGSVSALYSNVGGLVGLLQSTSSINHAYATGHVSPVRSSGGLIGLNFSAGAVTNSYWDTETTGLASSGGGTGLTTAQLHTALSFTGWDIATQSGSTSVWRIYEGQTAPLLRSFLTAATVTGASGSKVYDGTTSVAGTYAVSGPTTVNNSLILGATTSSKNVGSYVVDLGGLYSTQQGYDLTVAPGAGLFSITAAPLTIAALSDSRAYDGTTASARMAMVDGLKAGDSVINLTQAYASRNVLGAGASTLNVTSYTVNDGNGGANYEVVTRSAVGTITPAPLTLGGVVAADKVYDGTTAASVSGGGLVGLFSGDAVTLNTDAMSGRFDNRNVGTDKPVSISGAALAGAGSANYTLAQPTGLKADITAALLQISADPASKVYDGTTDASTTWHLSTGSLFGTDTLDSARLSFDTRHAGSNKSLLLSDAVVSDGNGGANYTITLADNAGSSITPAHLVLTADAAYKAYDGNTDAQTTWHVSSGALFGTDVLSSVGLSYDTAEIGINKTLHLSEAVLADGNGGANYTITLADNAASRIAAANAGTLRLAQAVAAVRRAPQPDPARVPHGRDIGNVGVVEHLLVVDCGIRLPPGASTDNCHSDRLLAGKPAL